MLKHGPAVSLLGGAASCCQRVGAKLRSNTDNTYTVMQTSVPSTAINKTPSETTHTDSRINGIKLRLFLSRGFIMLALIEAVRDVLGVRERL